MKKFLKWSIIFLLPVLLTGICYEILLRKIPNDYRYKKEYLDKNARKIQALFLGSSHTYYGINPAYSSVPGFNAGYVFQSLDYDLAILRKYEQAWDSLKYIVVPVDYFSLYSRLGTGLEAWRVKNYNLYWDMDMSRNIVEHSEVLTNSLNANATRFTGFYLKKNSFITSSALGWGTGYDSTRELMISGKSAAERHLAKNDKYFNENVAILKSIIEFAKAKNIKVVLITSPAYRSYVDNLDKQQLGRTTQTASAIAADYNNTVYFNHLSDSSFAESDFYDGDHLNNAGAKKYTLKLDSLIRTAEKNGSF